MTDDHLDLAAQLTSDPAWTWADGMKRLTADGQPTGRHPDGTGPFPDLTDFATGGALVGVLDAMGVLVDIARVDEGFVVAVESSEGVKGWLGDTLAEAAGWALLDTWADREE